MSCPIPDMVCQRCLGKGHHPVNALLRATYLALAAHGEAGLTPTALAPSLGITPQAMSQRLSRLEAVGLLRSEAFGRERVYTVVHDG